MPSSSTTAPLLLSLFITLLHLPLHAQSSAKGTVLIQEDFSGGEAPANPAQWSASNWNVPDTWVLRDGAIASIYDPKAHPGKAHGASINPKFKAHDIRVSYRVRFDGPEARLSVLPNAPFPKVTGIPVWHLGDINARASRDLPAFEEEKNKTTSKPRTTSTRKKKSKAGGKDELKDQCLGISERDFTHDVNDPRNVRKSFGPADIFKPLGAYEIGGMRANAAAPLRVGQWHQFVVECVGTQWTIWVDGEETLTMTLKHSKIEKETINFIASGPLMLDDLVVEELPAAK